MNTTALAAALAVSTLLGSAGAEEGGVVVFRVTPGLAAERAGLRRGDRLLSWAQTGLGKEVAGEGLLGLTWAFQYAGARSVLASLWEVNDASTAELMRRFYGHRRAGAPKAEALRRAQVELLRRPASAAPFFWAAFQRVGDFR